MNYLFGIDIGGTTIKIGFLTEDGTIVSKYEITTNKKENGKFILKDIADSILSYISDNKIQFDDIKGIGFGIPGPVANNHVSVCVNLGWENVSVAEEFAKLIPFKTNIMCGNDANAASLGEMWKGNELGYKDVVMLTLGTGVGAGVIISGKAVEGFNGAGGELGHARIDFKHNFQCNCGLKGCLETVTSATGVVNIAKSYLEYENSVLKNKDFTCKDVFDAAKSNDELALKVVEEVYEYLGYMCSIIAATTNPSAIIIGGGVSKAGSILIDGINKYFKQYAFKAVVDTKIILATLGNDAGMIGAAYSVK